MEHGTFSQSNQSFKGVQLWSTNYEVVQPVNYGTLDNHVQKNLRRLIQRTL